MAADRAVLEEGSKRETRLAARHLLLARRTAKRGREGHSDHGVKFPINEPLFFGGFKYKSEIIS